MKIWTVRYTNWTIWRVNTVLVSETVIILDFVSGIKFHFSLKKLVKQSQTKHYANQAYQKYLLL